ncbi:MAG: hypothetical protein Crog4KO_07510 [Crocinitomicaceae bacterium]
MFLVEVQHFVPEGPSCACLDHNGSYEPIRADFQSNFVEISYELPPLEIYSVQIYRAKTGDPMRRWKTITDLNEQSIRDKSISIGERYEYQVKYITEDGIHSLPLSLEVTF